MLLGFLALNFELRAGDECGRFQDAFQRGRICRQRVELGGDGAEALTQSRGFGIVEAVENFEDILALDVLLRVVRRTEDGGVDLLLPQDAVHQVVADGYWDERTSLVRGGAGDTDAGQSEHAQPLVAKGLVVAGLQLAGGQAPYLLLAADLGDVDLGGGGADQLAHNAEAALADEYGAGDGPAPQLGHDVPRRAQQGSQTAD